MLVPKSTFPLGKLLEITNVLPNADINFIVSDIGKVNIECNYGKYSIMGQSYEEFPSEQTVENSQELIVSVEELKDIITTKSEEIDNQHREKIQ